jgi:hypothetical protein
MIGRRSIEVTCVVDIEQTHDSFHVHAVPEGIDIRPGDSVLVHAETQKISFGERRTYTCRATVTRAGILQRLWTRLTALFELTELYEVGFDSREIMRNRP